MSSSAKSAEPPFAAEGGIDAPPPVGDDPYRTLDDLMTTIEALCPIWPQREALPAGTRMLL